MGLALSLTSAFPAGTPGARNVQGKAQTCERRNKTRVRNRVGVRVRVRVGVRIGVRVGVTG